MTRILGHRSWWLPALAATCGVVSCGGDDEPGERSAAKTTTAGIDRASGTRAVAEASASVDAPASIRIRVSAAPRRRLAVAYALICESVPRRVWDYEATPPHTRSVELPAAAHGCAIAAHVEIIRGSGRVKVTLLVSER